VSRAKRRIVTIDCQYVQSRFAAAYLVIDGDQAAFIDNNTAHCVPLLLDALKRERLRPEQVKWVIITHVHLDHAGGTSSLMAACPAATLLAHPRAARQMIDPAKLIGSARQVYGDEAFERMYGTILPVPAARVRSMEDGEQLPLGQGAPLRFFHTRGHANHHQCIFDPETRSVFTGDSFGLAYPDLQSHGLFIFPSTSPTGFEYEEALSSLRKIVDTGAERAYLTHFGELTRLEEAAAQLRDSLDHAHRISQQAAALPADQRQAFLEKEIWSHLDVRAAATGFTLNPAQTEMLKMDVELNAQGLAFVIARAESPR
jgi:glyoxylase-like metal-dependent hydrolase (beta-lactamase superfamily II)